MNIKIAKPQCISEVGQRKGQEDSMYPVPFRATADDRFFILCDGMGGHEFGEVASRTVCEEMGRWLDDRFDPAVFDEQAFNEALDSAYDGLDRKDNPEMERKMGTTLTFLAFCRKGCLVAHIGDSRIYQIRPSGHRILYKSRDHSLVYDLFEMGEITEEEMESASNRNVITRAMQPHQERRSKADVRLLSDVRPGDYFYLCSDGMLEQMKDAALVELLCDETLSDEAKRQALLENSRENHDNHSAFLIRVEQVESEPEDENAPESGGEEEVVITQVEHTDDTDAVSAPQSSSSMVATPVPSSQSDSQERPGETLPSRRPMRTIGILLLMAIIFALVYYVTAYFLSSKG